jgi:four helix bundle protein
MKICLKELRETKVWLIMIIRANLIKPKSNLESDIIENDELISIFMASIKTARQNK